MVLGLYYITKLRKGAKGEGLTFYGPEAVSYTHLFRRSIEERWLS